MADQLTQKPLLVLLSCFCFFRAPTACAFTSLAFGGASPPSTARMASSKSVEKVTSDAMRYPAPKSSKVRIPKPLGIVLEEISSGENENEKEDAGGVHIIQVHPDGNAAKYLQKHHGGDSPILCIRDKLMAVNGKDVSTESFDTVMETIISSNSPMVELTLQRPENSAVVQWSSNGIYVAAQPGDYLGNLASESGVKISYSCRSGSCGTCEQAVSIVDDRGRREKRYCRPCSFRVPKHMRSLTVAPSDRLFM